MVQDTSYDFAVDPAAFGLPSRSELVDHRIWSLHYHGINDHQEVMQYVNRMGLERVVSLDIAGGWYDDETDELPPPPDQATQFSEQIRILEESEGRVLGIIRIDPSRPELSVQHMNNWIANGPAIGIKYLVDPQNVTCAHPNNDAIIQRADELNAVIYIHTWMKTGGDPPTIAGDNLRGESTPMDVATLAARFPDVPMVCGHSGGKYELAVRAIRPHENVLFEYSGTPPWSGMVDYGANWVGTERLIWGGHGPSRSLSTELSKVFDSDLGFDDRKQVLGGNLRRIASDILERKGLAGEI